MKKFELNNIMAPGRIHSPGRGELVLSQIDDTLAEQLYKEGCPFLRPVPQERAKINPKEKVIDPTIKTPDKKSDSDFTRPAEHIPVTMGGRRTKK